MIKTVNRRPARDAAESVVQRFATCLGVRRNHDKGHSRVRAAVSDLIGAILEFLDTSEHRSLRLVVRDARITHDGRALGLGDGTINAIGKLLKKRECGGIVFGSDVTSASVNALLDWLMGRRARPAAASCAGMDVLEPSALDLGPSMRPPLRVEQFAQVSHLAEASHALMVQISGEIRQGHSLDLNEVRELARWTADVLGEHGIRVIAPMMLGPAPDSPFGRAAHVFLLASAFLHPYARSREELESFCTAAFLHDIGLSHVADDALERDLDEVLEAEFRAHPEHGADILMQCSGMPPLALEVAFCHHLGGTDSYPELKHQIRPGPVSDAVRVADRLEHLTSPEIAGARLSFKDALNEILRDPSFASCKDVVHAFCTSFTTMPPGTQLKTQSGSAAVVVESFPETPARPRIAIVADNKGRRPAEPILLDLRRNDDEDNVIAAVKPRPDKRVR